MEHLLAAHLAESVSNSLLTAPVYATSPSRKTGLAHPASNSSLERQNIFGPSSGSADQRGTRFNKDYLDASHGHCHRLPPHHHRRHQQQQRHSSKQRQLQNFRLPLDPMDGCSLCTSNPITPSSGNNDFNGRPSKSQDQATSDTHVNRTRAISPRLTPIDSPAMEFQLLNAQSILKGNNSRRSQKLQDSNQTTTNESLSQPPPSKILSRFEPERSSQGSPNSITRKTSIDPAENLSLPNIFSLSPSNLNAFAAHTPFYQSQQRFHAS